MSKDPRRAQKAALKRRQREKEVREELARKKAQAAAAGRDTVARASDLPVADCVISKGWKERGLAHILVARELPTGKLVAAGYYVDVLCVGLKNTALLPNVSREDYEGSVKPNLFNDPVEFEPCAPGLARAVVEGSIAFAGTYGFRPNKRWEETRKILEGLEGFEEVAFGRDGRPCVILRKGENVAGVLARLERTVGAGGYLVEKAPED